MDDRAIDSLGLQVWQPYNSWSLLKKRSTVIFDYSLFHDTDNTPYHVTYDIMSGHMT